jgi:glycosyltransferase involved in cell wall biosynthesis
MSFFIDLTELLTNPRRTGIERISGEICRHLPTDLAIPVRLHSGRFFAFPPALIDVIGKYFVDDSATGATEIRRLGAIENGSAISVSSTDTVLITEIFGEERASFFRRKSEQELSRYRFIVYDLLPLTHPEYFPVSMPVAVSAYYQIIRRATNCGFISGYTRDVYYDRLKRINERGGIVLPLGCDSLGTRPRHLALNRPLTFSVLGTIEPRKNHALILEAFEPLLQQIEGLSLSFLGKAGWDAELTEKVTTLASRPNSRFHFYSSLDDETIRKYIEQSRATIYVSNAEGYGLPPVESLWLGTPVIASAMNPSLRELGSSAGIHFVDPLNVINLRRAILTFLEDDYANKKTEETMQLNLPTWQSFTREVLRWCGQEATLS